MVKQYGAIPFVYDDGELKVVLVTSAAGYWIFPKGSYEKKLGKEGTAALEALEEAGVEGRIDKRNAYHAKVFAKSGDRVSLTLYPLEVGTMHSEWDEDYRRKRTLATMAEAEKLITSEELAECLFAFQQDYRK